MALIRDLWQKFGSTDLLPEHEWPTEEHWKMMYPSLFPDSSSEPEDKQRQVGHQLLLKEKGRT